MDKKLKNKVKNWIKKTAELGKELDSLNREANKMYDYASSKNIAIFNAAPYAGGVLAKGPDNF